MDKETLNARRDKAEQAFNTLNNILQTLKRLELDSLGDIEAELHRLQGEYRLLDEQLKALPEETDTKPIEPTDVSPDAATIDVRKVEGGAWA